MRQLPLFSHLCVSFHIYPSLFHMYMIAWHAMQPCNAMQCVWGSVMCVGLARGRTPHTTPHTWHAMQSRNAMSPIAFDAKPLHNHVANRDSTWRHGESCFMARHSIVKRKAIRKRQSVNQLWNTNQPCNANQSWISNQTETPTNYDTPCNHATPISYETPIKHNCQSVMKFQSNSNANQSWHAIPRLYIYMHINVYIYIYIYICTCIYIYVHIYAN